MQLWHVARFRAERRFYSYNACSVFHQSPFILCLHDLRRARDRSIRNRCVTQDCVGCSGMAQSHQGNSISMHQHIEDWCCFYTNIPVVLTLAFVSGPMIDRCNANSAHHRAFISASSLAFMKSLHPTYAEWHYWPSNGYFSLDTRLRSVIYHPWKSLLRTNWFLDRGITCVPYLFEIIFGFIFGEKFL